MKVGLLSYIIISVAKEIKSSNFIETFVEMDNIMHLIIWFKER